MNFPPLVYTWTTGGAESQPQQPQTETLLGPGLAHQKVYGAGASAIEAQHKFHSGLPFWCISVLPPLLPRVCHAQCAADAGNGASLGQRFALRASPGSWSTTGDGPRLSSVSDASALLALDAGRRPQFGQVIFPETLKSSRSDQPGRFWADMRATGVVGLRTVGDSHFIDASKPAGHRLQTHRLSSGRRHWPKSRTDS